MLGCVDVYHLRRTQKLQLVVTWLCRFLLQLPAHDGTETGRRPRTDCRKLLRHNDEGPCALSTSLSYVKLSILRRSRVFQSCVFHSLQSGPMFSGPAFSTLCFGATFSILASHSLSVTAEHSLNFLLDIGNVLGILYKNKVLFCL